MCIFLGNRDTKGKPDGPEKVGVKAVRKALVERGCGSEHLSVATQAAIRIGAEGVGSVKELLRSRLIGPGPHRRLLHLDGFVHEGNDIGPAALPPQSVRPVVENRPEAAGKSRVVGKVGGQSSPMPGSFG